LVNGNFGLARGTRREVMSKEAVLTVLEVFIPLLSRERW
jgi:hypothetical protein